ncbi:MAG: hypothetical protein AB7O52_12090 [Planctomycetota bacterium]
MTAKTMHVERFGLPSCGTGRGTRFGLALPGLALLLGWGLASGCSTPRNPAENEVIEVSHNTQYNDLPVPFGFDFDQRESWAYREFEEAAMPFRSCSQVYWGDQPIRHLATWYESQMGQYGWHHEQTIEGKSIQLIFTKGIERSEIDLVRTIDRGGRDPITKLTCRIVAN